MKNYVAPKSVVLSMNMNENIAISSVPFDFFKVNTNTGVFVNSTVVQAEISRKELWDLITTPELRPAGLADCLLD